VRTTANHHEQNTKRLRDKLAKTENELVKTREEYSRLRGKIANYKATISRLEHNEKKMKLALQSSKES